MRFFTLRIGGCLLLGLSGVFQARAQVLTKDILYDFSQAPGASDTFRSEIKFVFADSNQIVVAGNVQKGNALPHIFTAAFDYSGTLQWKKELQVPSGFAESALSGFVNLKKLNNGDFVVAGLLRDAPGNDSLQIPFLYFFSGNGDSLRYRQMDNRPLWRLGALNTDDTGNILIGGLYGRVTPANAPVDPPYSDSIWIVKLNETGAIIWNNEINENVPFGRYINLHNIIQIEGAHKYVISLSRDGGLLYPVLTMEDAQPGAVWSGGIGGTSQINFYMVGISLNGSLIPGISLIKRKHEAGFYF